MRILITIIIILFSVSTPILWSQSASTITFEAGSSIEVQSGAEICATNILINGSWSGGGRICGGPLPVTILSFTAGALNRNNVKLEWITGVELNNSGFEIERKTLKKGEGWLKVGFINGNGTTNEPRSYSFEDKKLQTNTYRYRLKQIDYNGNFEYFDLSSDVSIAIPKSFNVSQNYPNPSNPFSKIEYEIPIDSRVTVKIYDVTGREVVTLVDNVKPAGYYTVEFDGTNLATGVYFYRINTPDFSDVKKLILVK